MNTNILTIKTKNLQTSQTIQLKGVITAKTVPILSKTIQRLLKKECHTIIMDLSEIEYIDSHGLGVFVYAWKALDEQNKKLLFFCPKGAAHDILTTTNLHKIIPLIEEEITTDATPSLC
ncbi:MAG: STAS domain-containing protein [Chitinivibrionales bacterium]|nr:STAS domain-containing protein [Chitinivibrionales bacterium]